MMDQLLTAADVAELLRTTRDVVYSPAWRRRIGLPAVRIGRSLRFRVADVQGLIARGVDPVLKGGA